MISLLLYNVPFLLLCNIPLYPWQFSCSDINIAALISLVRVLVCVVSSAHICFQTVCILVIYWISYRQRTVGNYTRELFSGWLHYEDVESWAGTAIQLWERMTGLDPGVWTLGSPPLVLQQFITYSSGALVPLLVSAETSVISCDPLSPPIGQN